MSNEVQNYSPCQIDGMNNAFYEVYHRADNNYVVWCKRELMTIDLFIFSDGIDWQPYPCFQNTKFPFDDIEQAVRKHFK